MLDRHSIIFDDNKFLNDDYEDLNAYQNDAGEENISISGESITERVASFTKEDSTTDISFDELLVSESAWVVPYGNLMTILMIFFLMLYAFATLGGSAQSQYEKAMARISKEMGGDTEHLRRIIEKEKETAAAEKMEEFIKVKNLSAFANLEINSQRVKIMLSNPVLFDIGSSSLKPSCIETLKEISALIKTMDSDVIVEGHTDNIPISVGARYRSNFELSAARAFSVIKFFIEDGINPSRFTAYGYGEHRPLYPNDTEEHRAANRRIEINVLRKKW